MDRMRKCFIPSTKNTIMFHPYRNNEIIFPKPNWFYLLLRNIGIIKRILTWCGTEISFPRRIIGGCWRIEYSYMFRGAEIIHYKHYPEITQPTNEFFSKRTWKGKIVEEFYG